VILRRSNQAWIGREGAGLDSFIVRRKKEPFPDVNVIGTFFVNEIKAFFML